MANDTLPIPHGSFPNQPDFNPLVDSHVVDQRSGAVWAHKDLVQVKAPWQDEEHISPIKALERFGDVESWSHYVTRYSFGDVQPFVTWHSGGLRAVLDYHGFGDKVDDRAGRAQWIAEYPFVRSPEWTAWTGLANGHGVPQAKAIEFLEDHAPDIVEPAPADLMALLRSLRGTVNKAATTTLLENGGTHVSFDGGTGVSARGGTTELPSEFTIGIPVLKGHTNSDGQAVSYKLQVRLRASVDDQARLALRFTIPLAERTLEAVFLDRVTAARELLGDGYSVLRAADG